MSSEVLASGLLGSLLASIEKNPGPDIRVSLNFEVQIQLGAVDCAHGPYLLKSPAAGGSL